MQEPGVSAVFRLAPEMTGQHLLLIFHQAVPQRGDVHKRQVAVMVLRMQEIPAPRISRRLNALYLGVGPHRLFRQGGLQTGHRVFLEIEEHDVVADVVEIAEIRRVLLLDIVPADLDVLNSHLIDVVVLAMGHHRTGKLHVVVPRGIRGYLRPVQFPELLVGKLPVEGMDRTICGVELFLPHPHVVDMIPTQHRTICGIREEQSHRSPVILHHTQWGVGLVVDFSQRIVVIPPCRLLDGNPLLLAVRLDLLARHRMSEIISLDLLATDTAQVLVLFFGFHPFSQGLDTDAFRHPDNGCDDRPCLLGGGGQKAHVDFQHVEGAVFQDA